VIADVTDITVREGQETDLAQMERVEVEAALAARGHEAFRARQLFAWIYKRGVLDAGLMTDLPRALRAMLAGSFTMSTPSVVATEESADGTRKFRLRLSDGREIESVFIPDTPAMTFCISTQVGCAMACGFCLTGKMGLVRHLSAGEIAGQVRVLKGLVDLGSRAYNVVLMGMGEPLHNYDETMKALRILTDEHGLSVPARRITLSTIGLPAALDRLAREPLMPNLAVSLHAPTDELRERLVPPARKYPLADIIASCRRFPLRKRSRITFEYVLLAGVNDRAEDAGCLADLLSGLQSKVNVIPLNPAAGVPFHRPSAEAIDRFAGVLARRGVTVSVRKSRGADIRAACGQLIVEGGRRSPAQRLAVRIG
jgi:23S rRNA (adenine2503-C2)-methyltransferase